MQDDADTIRRAYEVWNESGPAAVTERFWAEDAVYREAPGWPNPGVYEGRAAALHAVVRGRAPPARRPDRRGGLLPRPRAGAARRRPGGIVRDARRRVARPQ